MNKKDLSERDICSNCHIRDRKCRKVRLFLSTIEEQNAIAEKVNALMGLFDALEQEVQKSQVNSEILMQSVLREVFEGVRKVVEI
ncbi:restriction endonuclease subunit S domain-containing protein [Maribacter ulvicola]|uniref:Type I restriction enzyme, S subunit n=1 Tax=Maribacter ulvicola TaxID=228959 RepID=A0A1N6YIQ1_9FLAO|nr:hypothetical protein [Maribacter ulvicola]SIR14430.1 type I restriction enzyme, S subunit [Maribacter ulvicola]